MLKLITRVVLFVLVMVLNASAWVDPSDLVPPGRANADKLHVTDGSYVMNIGELQVNITNHGLIGSQYSHVSSFSDAPSAQWPGGSGIEYMFSAGLWVGGIKNGRKLVSTGQYERELRPLPGPEHTIYEARYGRRVRPTLSSSQEGARIFETGGDDDGDLLWNEDPLNGLDDDHDGLVDEDFGQLGSQMMVCTMVDNTALALEEYPDHEPLDIEVRQTAFAWEMDAVDDVVIFAYTITNIGSSPIEQLRVGMFVDGDIGPRDRGDAPFDDMAGRFTGMARASNGLFESVDIAYMYDGGETDRVPGYIGVMYRGANSFFHGMRSFQYYTGERAYALGGDPTNDAERYNELEKSRSDPNVIDGNEADYRILATNGSFGTLRPGRSISFEVVLACGNGLEGLLENCANIQQSWEGAWYDLDHDRQTGIYGRESFLCIEDFGMTLAQFPVSPFAENDANYFNAGCVPGWAKHFIIPSDLQIQLDGRHCIWVNQDACDECETIRGRPCFTSNFFRFWNCKSWWLSPSERSGCTGVGGRESVVRWLTSAAPPPPVLRVWPVDHAVHVYWNDSSEYELDNILGFTDFESYRVWRASGWDRPPGTSVESGPSSRQWSLLGEFDLDNEYFRQLDLGDYTVVDTLPLGANTGLEGVLYRPSCLDNVQFSELAEDMNTAFSYGIHIGQDFRISVRDGDDMVRPGMDSLVRWEMYPAVLDTFYWALPWDGGADPNMPDKRAVRFYEYIDTEVHNGFLYFYSVTASDHDMFADGDGFVLTGPGVQGDPSTSFASARPGTRAQTITEIERYGQGVYVYPNPATQESLDEFQRMHPNADDPTGWRIMFANLPACRSRIEVYTVSGDLVDRFDHDGTAGHGEVDWNLVSRNGQQIVSGVYLYVVRTLDADYQDYIGKFVVIR